MYNSYGYSALNKEAVLGAAGNIRGMINTATLITAFVLSIMVINNYRQCENGKGYPTNAPIVKMSYGVAVLILIAAVLLLALDLAKMGKIIP
jgi:hypothetical protein